MIRIKRYNCAVNQNCTKDPPNYTKDPPNYTKDPPNYTKDHNYSKDPSLFFFFNVKFWSSI
jgi:hypothetical protein